MQREKEVTTEKTHPYTVKGLRRRDQGRRFKESKERIEANIMHGGIVDLQKGLKWMEFASMCPKSPPQVWIF
jgi:hypothetical protein